MKEQNDPVLERDVRELSLGDMLIQVFRKWKVLLVVAIIGALLFTGYSCLTGASGPRAQAARDAAAAAAEEAANVELDEASQIRVDGMTELRSRYREIAVSQGEYMQNSIYMQLDPYAVNRTTATFFVFAEGDTTEEQVDALISVYQDAALSREVLEPIAEEYGTEYVYLREVVGCGSDLDLNKFWVNVSYTDPEGSMNICQKIVNAVEARTESYAVQIGPHNLMMTVIAGRVVTDNGLFDNQYAVWSDIHNMNVAINKIGDDINDFRHPSGSDGNVEGQRSIPADVAIGGAAGLIVSFVILCLAYLLSDKLRSDDEVRRMAPVRVWANGITPKAHSGSALALDKLQGMTPWEEGAYQRFADILAPELEGKNSLLLVTALAEKEVSEIAEELEKALNVKFSEAAGAASDFRVNICAKVSDSYTAVEAIRGAEAVLAVERCHLSSLKKVRAELELLSHVREDAMGVMVRGI